MGYRRCAHPGSGDDPGRLLLGAGAGGLSTLAFKHALLPRPSLRIATLLALPPMAGWQCHRLLRPAETWEERMLSPRFGLPLLAALSFCAARLVGITR